jgi:putative acetyltransferase
VTTGLRIRLDELQDPRIAAFLEEHLADMRRFSPPESVHALDLAGLRQPNIRFWTAWIDLPTGESQLVATAALKHLDDGHAELKSMRTSAALRGQGIAGKMLVHVIEQARALGHARLSLETGSQPFFQPAHALYEKHGFQACAPFGTYTDDPNSRFMTRPL